MNVRLDRGVFGNCAVLSCGNVLVLLISKLDDVPSCESRSSDSKGSGPSSQPRALSAIRRDLPKNFQVAEALFMMTCLCHLSN